MCGCARDSCFLWMAWLVHMDARFIFFLCDVHNFVQLHRQFVVALLLLLLKYFDILANTQTFFAARRQNCIYNSQILYGLDIYTSECSIETYQSYKPHTATQRMQCFLARQLKPGIIEKKSRQSTAIFLFAGRLFVSISRNVMYQHSKFPSPN